MWKIKFICFYIVVALITTYVYRLSNQGAIAFNQGEKYFSKKMYDKAIDYYLKAFELDIDSSIVTIHLNQALHKSSDLGKSNELLDMLIEKDSKNINALKELAKFFMEIENYSRAVKTYRYILKLNPEDEYSRFELALALTRNGEYEQAIEEYEMLLKEPV